MSKEVRWSDHSSVAPCSSSHGLTYKRSGGSIWLCIVFLFVGLFGVFLLLEDLNEDDKCSAVMVLRKAEHYSHQNPSQVGTSSGRLDPERRYFVLQEPLSSHTLASSAWFHLGSLQKTPTNLVSCTLGQSTSFPKNVIAWKTQCSCSWVSRRGFHTPYGFCSRGRGHRTAGSSYAASLPTQLTPWAWRKPHHLHSPWVTSGLRQFTLYILVKRNKHHKSLDTKSLPIFFFFF